MWTSASQRWVVAISTARMPDLYSPWLDVERGLVAERLSNSSKLW